MNFKTTFAAAVLAIVAMASPVAVMAADFLVAPVPANPISRSVDAVHFDGAYVGVSGTYVGKEFTPTLSAGVDKRYDFVVVGGEVFADLEKDGIKTIGFDAKAGFVLTNNVAVYAIGGIQTDRKSAVARNAIGVGADVALTDNVYLTGSYKQVYDLGTFDNRDDRVSVGLKFRF